METPLQAEVIEHPNGHHSIRISHAELGPLFNVSCDDPGVDGEVNVELFDFVNATVMDRNTYKIF